MARSALLLLASEPDYREGLTALMASPPPERMLGPWETMALASAVLVVLQTHFKFERDKQGRWSVNLEKKPTDVQLLKSVIQKPCRHLTEVRKNLHSLGDPMHRLIVRQVKGAERFVVSLSNGRSAEDEATVASPREWSVRVALG